MNDVSSALDRKIRGWQTLVEGLRAMAAQCRAEAERLLGPERGA